MSPLVQEVNDVVSTLFQRYPALCGFSLKEDLSFSHIACHPALMGEEAEILCEDISATLNELLEARPEAADLLRGRTLARMFHEYRRIAGAGTARAQIHRPLLLLGPNGSPGTG
jgi:hypothetical protein